MPVASMRRKTDRLPEGKACRGRVDGNQPARDHARKQCRSQLKSDTTPTECWPDVEAPHAQSMRYDGLDGEAADPSEHVIQARGEQRLVFAIEARCARFPIGREPFDLTKAFGARFGT